MRQMESFGPRLALMFVPKSTPRIWSCADMPIYEYEILNNDGIAKGVFETSQRMSEPALTKHPVTGEPVRRILSRTFVGGGRSSGGAGYGAESCTTGTCGIPSPGGCASGTCGWD
jgi:predicted nucleic acid-binding Zn ribbon protein